MREGGREIGDRRKVRWEGIGDKSKGGGRMI